MKSITKIIPRYAETDKMGVIHHSVYPVWFELGRVDFSREMGIPVSELESRNLFHAIMNLNVNFKHPAYFGDELTLTTKVKTYSKIKVEFEYEIFNQDNKLINIGTTLLVWLDDSLKPLNITKNHQDLYDAIANSTLE